MNDTNNQERHKWRDVWTRTWWTFVVLGGLAVAFGLFALVNPQATASLPLQLLGGFMGLDGLFKVITAVFDRQYNRAARISGGFIEIFIGSLLFVLAADIIQATLAFILYLAGFGFLIAGGISIVQALQGRRDKSSLLTGALKLGFGLLLFGLTGPIAISLVWITGIFLLGIGGVLLVVGLRIRRLGQQLGATMSGATMSGDIIEGDIIEGDIIKEEGVNAEMKQIPDHLE